MTDTSLQEQKFQKMTTRPIGPLITSLALPAIISMMVSAIYNLADTAFISHTGPRSTQAVAAIGVIFSYQAVANAIGFFFGHGSGNFISRALGRRDRGQAAQMAATGAGTSFLAGLLLSIISLLLNDKLLFFLGASPDIIAECRAYFRYIVLATPFFTTQLTLNNQLRLQGNAHLGMIGIMSGAILNIILDPLLIFHFRLGVSGASLATALSQLTGCLILFALTHVRDGIPPKLSNFRPSWANYKEIIAGGLPSLARQLLNAVGMVVLNRYAVSYGPAALAALSIVNRLVHLTLCIAIGVGQGFQPVCGFNFGAKLFSRVRAAYFFGIKLNTAILVLATVILYFFSQKIIALFGSSAEAALIANRAIHYYLWSLPFLGFIVMTEMILQNTRQTLQASLLSATRQGIAMVPAVIILNYFFELEGVLWAQPAANIVALLLALPFAKMMLDLLHERGIK